MDLLNNFARSALVGGITDSATTIELMDGTPFPTRDFHILLNPNDAVKREIIRIGSRTGTTLTVAARGVEGTTAKAHLSGDQVIHTALAHNFPKHVNRQTVNNPDVTLLRPGSDEFDDGVLNPAWVQVKRSANTSISTWTEKNDVLSCYHDGADLSGELLALIRPMNGMTAPVTIEVAQRVFSTYATNYIMWGPMFSSTDIYGTGSQVFAMPYIDTNTAGYRQSFRRAVNYVSDADYGTANIQLVSPLYIRIRWNVGNTYECFWSSDGVSWIRYPNATQAFDFTPNFFGLYVSHWGTTRTSISTFEYFRVY